MNPAPVGFMCKSKFVKSFYIRTFQIFSGLVADAVKAQADARCYGTAPRLLLS